MKKYPLFRLKLVLAGDWHQFSNWLRENPMKEGEDIVFVRNIQSLVGRQKDNVELVKTGEWWKNEDGKEAIGKLYPFFTDELFLEPDNNPVPIQVSARYRPDPTKLENMEKEVREIENGVVYCVSPEVQELTKDIPCPWCPAKEKQSCFIQIPAEEQELLHKTYRLGSDYIPEIIHLARWKNKK